LKKSKAWLALKDTKKLSKRLGGEGRVAKVHDRLEKARSNKWREGASKKYS